MSLVILARWFAFVVIALGLQVPGDLSFRVCLCEGLLGAGLALGHECKTAPRPAPTESCCSEGEDREAPPERAQCESGDRCGCVLVHVPHRPDTPKLQSATSTFDLVAPALASAGFDPAPRWTRPAILRSREHDPPWARANVPLRI